MNLTERGTLLVWEDDNGWQITNTFNSAIALSKSASVSPNGSYIAISGFDLNDDPILQVFDIQMGTLTTVIQATNYPIGPVAWNFDGTLLATNGENGVNIWDWDAPIPLVATLEKSDTFNVRALAWHPSRNMLVGATSTIWLWDINTSSLLTSIETNQNITTIAWSPDAQKLAVGGFDGSLVIFTIND